MTVWLYLDFPILQLDTLYHVDNQAAIVIVDGRNNTIVQLNHVALHSGITLGMGIGTATALCQQLQIHPYNEQLEQEKLSEIADWLYMHTSDISLVEPKGLLLRTNNMLALYDGLENYWRALKEHIVHLGIHFHYATGFTPYAAQLLAKAGTNLITHNQTLVLERIALQPLVMTELPSKTIKQLTRVGIKQLKALLDTPLVELAKRFDGDLVNYVGQLSGQFKHPVVFYQPPESFKRHIECLYDIENLLWLERPLSILLKQLEQFLFIRGLVAHELQLILHQRDTKDISLSLCSAAGEYQQSKWLVLLQLRLGSVELDAPITRLTLETKHQVAKQATEFTLFSDKQGAITETELISTLQAKLGEAAIMGVQYIPDARPENANKLCQPLSAPKNTPSTATKLRPSLLFPVPEPLKDKVTVMQGPERIATGWWDGSPIIRDYFIARSEQGRWLWVYRTPEQEWFTHGTFS
ncbi:Y-family DNA polymerase [Thalassotalea atypica]|uniref:Y-family DNA polymerase n=1 Tax=Thalassotalea atypica TaxID=2054316 RepID=UPI0025731E5E|nr:DNA polymerase Y family protein [Thalassotalea atypica]